MNKVKKINVNILVVISMLVLYFSFFCSYTLAKYSPILTIPLYLKVNGDYTVTEIGNTVTITKYIGNGGNVIIPSSLNNKQVTAIGSNAFDSNANITGISIPTTITSIGTRAFYNCSGLRGTLNLPNTIITIDEYAFSNCTGLTGNLNLPNSITNLGVRSF